MRLLEWVARTFMFFQVDDYINNAPGGGGGEPTQQTNDRPDTDIIGGYVRPGPGLPSISQNLYGPGSYTPGTYHGYRQNDMQRILGSLVNQGSVLDLQEALVAAGLLSGDVQFGVIDSATESAFETLLSIANQNGLDWRDVLSQGAQSGAFATSDVGGSGAAPLSPTMIALPNRDDLDSLLEREIGMSLTGERLDDDLRAGAVESVLDALRTQQERQVQREMDLAGTGEGVAFVESAPDVNRLLEEQVRERAPQKVMNKQTRDAMETWFEMIGEPL